MIILTLVDGYEEIFETFHLLKSCRSTTRYHSVLDIERVHKRERERESSMGIYPNSYVAECHMYTYDICMHCNAQNIVLIYESSTNMTKECCHNVLRRVT